MKKLIRKYIIPSPREEMLESAMALTGSSMMEGDYLEFGVYEGKTFISAFKYAKRMKLESMKFYAFDSFEGLPEPKGIDVGCSDFFKGLYSCCQNEFKEIISGKGVDLNKVTIVEGFFNKTLNEETKKNLQIKKALVIFIDCDLYHSTVPVLDFITDYLQNGTVLILDDYYCFGGDPNKGEQRAFNEWLEKNQQIKATEYKRFGWHGNSFIIHVIDEPNKSI